MKTAILVDGGFYRRRSQSMWGEKSAVDRAGELCAYCRAHMKIESNSELYRIFYYDCPPMSKKVYHPFLKKTIDFEKTELYKWTMEFMSELKKKRKFALRLGKLSESQAHYELNPDIVKKICSEKLEFADLKEKDFSLRVEQKGVDMKIGLDISSLAYKHQVGQIILISADSDFVPAAKLARREGIDFILDAMHSTIKPELYEHIDGLRSPKFGHTKNSSGAKP